MYVLASPSLLEPSLYVTHLKALNVGLRNETHTTLHGSRSINPPSTIHSLLRLDTRVHTAPILCAKRSKQTRFRKRVSAASGLCRRAVASMSILFTLHRTAVTQAQGQSAGVTQDVQTGA
jgi:hypothetical protein